MSINFSASTSQFPSPSHTLLKHFVVDQQKKNLGHVLRSSCQSEYTVYRLANRGRVSVAQEPGSFKLSINTSISSCRCTKKKKIQLDSLKANEQTA